MKSLVISVIAICSAFMLAAASYVPATNLSAPDPKYSVVVLSWAVETIPGNTSSTIILNGTVQEVDQELIDINPDYMNLLNKYRESQSSMPSQDVVRSVGSMDDRRDCGYCQVCTKRWPPAGVGSILDVIKWLDGASGRPGMPPVSCGPVGCSGGSQVWLCNDSSDKPLDLDSWSQVARAVEDIARQCFWLEKEKSSLIPVTGGQIFEPNGWNVIVRGDTGSCPHA